MIRRRFFSHFGTKPPGQTLEQRLRRVRYIRARRSWIVGENLAWGTRRMSTPARVHRAWMRSTGHRANILHPTFRDVGIGIEPGNADRAQARRDLHDEFRPQPLAGFAAAASPPEVKYPASHGRTFRRHGTDRAPH